MAKGKPKHKLRETLVNPRKFAVALKEAQAELDATPERPTPGQKVPLRVADIQERPELFQPRGFYLGAYKLDNNHVQKLAREMKIRGELAPLLVIKLKDQWVMVDGHHRLQAYKNLEWNEPITCEWFAGSVLEASDLSGRLNNVAKLEMTQHDKLEMAWRRVVLGGYSKRELVDLCGVAYGTVSRMRKVLKVYNDTESEKGKQFRERIAKDSPNSEIDALSWRFASMAFNGMEPEEISKHERAVALAGRMHDRLGDRLSGDPEVTATAIAIYDSSLPNRLLDHLRFHAERLAGLDLGFEDNDPFPADRVKPDYWRQRAEAMHVLARKTNDTGSQETLLRIAADYELLAKGAEERPLSTKEEAA